MSDTTSVRRISFELDVLPETATQRWQAFLRRRDGDDRTIVFDSPLELVRHLASWTDDRTRARGVR